MTEATINTVKLMDEYELLFELMDAMNELIKVWKLGWSWVVMRRRALV